MGWSSSRMLLATAKQHAAEKFRIIPRFMEMGLKMWCMPQNVQFTPQMSSSMGKIWQNEVLNHQIWVVVHQKVQTTPQEPWSKTSTSAVFCWKLRLLPRDVAAARVSSQSSATNARHTLAAAKKKHRPAWQRSRDAIPMAWTSEAFFFDVIWGLSPIYKFDGYYIVKSLLVTISLFTISSLFNDTNWL